MGHGSDDDDYPNNSAYGTEATSGDGDDNDNNNNNNNQNNVVPPSSPSSTPAETTPAPALPTDSVGTLIIFWASSNGDKFVGWPTVLDFGTTTFATFIKTKICAPTPLPSAGTTIHKEHLTSPTPAPASSSDSSAAASSYSISQGTLDPSQLSDQQTPAPTSPSSSTPAGFGIVNSSTSPSPNQQTPSPQQDGDHHSSHPPIGALVVVPFVIIGALIAAFVVWRRKRRARRAALGMTEEMKMARGPEDGLPQYTPHATGTHVPLMTPASALAHPTTGTTTSLVQTTSATPSVPADGPPVEPVILNSNMGGAYFTGIDTSDAVSLTSNNHNNMHAPGNRMSFDQRSMNSSDEPPPPYRPRSVPPISRETSLRQPNAPNNISQMLAPLSEISSRLGSSGGGSYEIDDFRVADGMRNPFEGGTPTAEGMNNPFDDPDNESVVSDMTSTPVSPLVEEGHESFGGRLTPTATARLGQQV